MSTISNECRIKLERAIVAALIAHMRKAGWVVSRTWDGEEYCFPRTDAQVLNAVFDLDEVSLRFVQTHKRAAFDRVHAVSREAHKPKGLTVLGELHGGIGGEWDDGEHGVLLVLGNGEDIISDWNFTEGDPDGFDRAISAFDVEKVRV